MKKQSYFLLGATGLLLASCANEEVIDLGLLEGETTVNFTIEAPQSMHTRAFGDGTTATNLKYQLYKLG